MRVQICQQESVDIADRGIDLRSLCDIQNIEDVNTTTQSNVFDRVDTKK
jgi:hypothetical protein